MPYHAVRRTYRRQNDTSLYWLLSYYACWLFLATHWSKVCEAGWHSTMSSRQVQMRNLGVWNAISPPEPKIQIFREKADKKNNGEVSKLNKTAYNLIRIYTVRNEWPMLKSSLLVNFHKNNFIFKTMSKNRFHFYFIFIF